MRSLPTHVIISEWTEHGKRWEPVIRILLVDDQPAVRQGLKMRLGLERDLVVVGEACDGAQALALAELLRPDIVIMDIEMGKADGLTATKHLAITMPKVAVVILTIYGDAATRRRAKAAGAAAFVEKQGGAAALLDEIRRVAQYRADREGGQNSD
jgi:DNA-binding NarL/FixJ family response regulator